MLGSLTTKQELIQPVVLEKSRQEKDKNVQINEAHKHQRGMERSSNVNMNDKTKYATVTFYMLIFSQGRTHDGLKDPRPTPSPC